MLTRQRLLDIAIQYVYLYSTLTFVLRVRPRPPVCARPHACMRVYARMYAPARTYIRTLASLASLAGLASTYAP